MKNLTTQRGLSLVELMISITLGLLILASMTTLLSNQSRTRSELDKSNRMVDNGRYALEIMSENLRVAGFYGSYTPQGTPAASPDPCDVALLVNPAANAQMLLHPVQGYNAAGATSQIASLPSACGFSYTAGSTASLLPGSDILVLRRASTATPVASASAQAATSYLQASNCNNDLSSYQLSAGSADFTALHDKDCSTVAGLRPFLVQVYFVSPDNLAGDGIPTLKRRELASTGAFVTTPLVEGIEYLQVDYGLDSDADGAADSYIAAPSSAQWPAIMSVRLNLLARNTGQSAAYRDSKTYSLGGAGVFGPFNDAYKRHVYTQVVRLVNPSSRREIP